MQFNKYQTQLTDEVISKYPKEVIDSLWEYINTVPFIQRLVSKDRKYASDLRRDEQGKIIVDLSNPHILTNMDYFRPTALHFKEHGCYTKLKVNTHPQSEYMKWFKEEVRRCWEGMIRPEDGEWVTGDMYFFLNYNLMVQTVVNTDKKGKKYGVRKDELPECWEGVYWRFHYLEQARYGGIHNDFTPGSHAAEIASRGKGKSYSLSSMLGRLFTVGLSQELNKNRKALIVADLKTYLIEDGTLNKFEDLLTHLGKTTQFPQRKDKDSLTNMIWVSGWTDSEGKPRGSQNLVIGQAIGDDPDKSRGKRSDIMLGEEFGKFGKFSSWWATSMPNVQEGEIVFGLGYVVGTGGCVCKGTKVYNRDGYITNIEDITKDSGILGYNNGSSIEDVTWIQEELYKECVEIICENDIKLKCSVDHPILSSKPNYYIKSKKIKKIGFTSAGLLNVGDEVMLCNKLNIEGIKNLDKAELIGLLIGDGNYSTKNSNVTLSVLGNELYNYLDNKYDFGISKISETMNKDIYAQIYFYNDIKKYLKEIGILYQKCENKTLPININNYNIDSISKLLSGLFEADGDVKLTKSGAVIRLTSKNINLLEQVKVQLLRFGINSNIRIEKKGGSLLKSSCNKNEYKMKEYDCGVLYISNQYYVHLFKNKIGFITSYKQNKLNGLNLKRVQNVYNDCRFIIGKNFRGHLLDNNVNTNLESIRIKEINKIGIQRVYNLTANNTNTYLCENIVTHNTEGSDFTGALDMIYAPESNHIYGIPNIYDKGAVGNKHTIFFFPAYINYKPYYNEDGVSDVIGAMLSELMQRYTLKYNADDPLKLTRRKAEFAFTIQEAIMRRDSTIYPVADLNDRLNQIDLDSTSLKDMFIGRLELSNGEVLWKPDLDLKPILHYPHKDNKVEGCIHIKQMPEKVNNSIPWGRYIAGADVYDDDTSNTSSLFAGYILDLWTDDIVAEYVGRPQFADDAYENWRRLLLLYNAECNYENNKKGMFTYFSKHNCLYLLSDTLEFLKDKDMMKASYGNKSKGTVATAPIKAYSRRCIRDYLLKPFNSIKIINGEEIIETVPLLFKIKFRALLQELASWNNDGNYDRHDALAMLMLLREDKLRLLGDNSFDDRRKEKDDYLGNDEFFNKNYKKFKSDNQKLKEQLEKAGIK